MNAAEYVMVACKYQLVQLSDTFCVATAGFIGTSCIAIICQVHQ